MSITTDAIVYRASHAAILVTGRKNAEARALVSRPFARK